MRGILTAALFLVSVPAFAQQDPGASSKEAPKPREVYEKNTHVDFTLGLELDGHHKTPFGIAFVDHVKRGFPKAIPERANFRGELESSLDRLAK